MFTSLKHHPTSIKVIPKNVACLKAGANGILLVNNSGSNGWLFNIDAAHNAKTINTAVYWALPTKLVGIRSSKSGSIVVVDEGTSIDIKDNSIPLHLHGVVSDVIIPNTNISDISSRYSSEQLGLGPNVSPIAAAHNISKILHKNPNPDPGDQCVGYEITITSISNSTNNLKCNSSGIYI